MVATHLQLQRLSVCEGTLARHDDPGVQAALGGTAISTRGQGTGAWQREASHSRQGAQLGL